MRKIDPATVPVGAKACSNYLNGYLVRRDANQRGFDVGLSLGTDGYLAEGSIESVFVVKDGTLKTPPLGRILSGITRKSILQAAPTIGIPVQETMISAEELHGADEMFTCYTSKKVVPISRFEDRQFSAPGAVTARLMRLMDDIIHFRNEQFSQWMQPLF